MKRNPIYNFFSFGGGVQSTALAIMTVKSPHLFGEYLPEAILFADTREEYPETTMHRRLMFKWLRLHGFKCFVVHQKDHVSLSKKMSLVPIFTRDKMGSIGMTPRQCTHRFKIAPIQRKMRQLMGLTKGQRYQQKANLILGISIDEAQRAKPAQEPWLNKIYPLVELGLSRNNCEQIIKKHWNFYPVPKSRCYFCPFQSAQQWENLKQLRPKLFQKAVELDAALRHQSTFGLMQLDNPCYLHRKGIPLSEVNNQLSFDFFYPEKSCDSGYCFI